MKQNPLLNQFLVLITAIALSGCASSPPSAEYMAKYPEDVKAITANTWIISGTYLDSPDTPYDYLTSVTFRPDGTGSRAMEFVGYAKPGKFFFLNTPLGRGIFHGVLAETFKWRPQGGGRISVDKASQSHLTGNYPSAFDKTPAWVFDLNSHPRWSPIGENDPRLRFSPQQIAALTNKWNTEGPPITEGAASQERQQNAAALLGALGSASQIIANGSNYNSTRVVTQTVPAPPRTSAPSSNSAAIISHINATQQTVSTVPAPTTRQYTVSQSQSVAPILAPALIAAGARAPQNPKNKISPGRQVTAKSFGEKGVQIKITVTKVYLYIGAEANRGEPYNSFKSVFEATMTNSNSKTAQFQFWVDAAFSNGRTATLNDGHGGLNAGRSIDKYLGSFEESDLVSMNNFKMKVQLK